MCNSLWLTLLGGAIAKAVVTLANAAPGPAVKHAPICTSGVGFGVRVQQVEQIPSGEDPLGYGDSKNRVVWCGCPRRKAPPQFGRLRQPQTGPGSTLAAMATAGQ
jgi:hypothetical protein